VRRVWVVSCRELCRQVRLRSRRLAVGGEAFWCLLTPPSSRSRLATGPSLAREGQGRARVLRHIAPRPARRAHPQRGVRAHAPRMDSRRRGHSVRFSSPASWPLLARHCAGGLFMPHNVQQPPAHKHVVTRFQQAQSTLRRFCSSTKCKTSPIAASKSTMVQERF
jgi:hypothetical protein